MHMQDKTEEFLHSLQTSSAGSISPPGLSRIWASPARHLRHFHFWPLV